MPDDVGRAVTRPILPSTDLAATSRFWGRFGFAEIGLWPGEYLIVRDPHDIELHFWHNRKVSRWTNDVGCWVGFPAPAQVQALYAIWSSVPVEAPALLNYPRAQGHLVEFQLIDPHGNLVRVGAPREDQ